MKNKATWFDYLVLITVSFFFILPIVWVFLSSFKPAGEIFLWPLQFISENATLENYKNAFSTGGFGRLFYNTAFISVFATIITLLINPLAGYALSKFRFWGRDTIFTIFLATVMIPLEVIMIPVFLVISELGLYNSLWGMIIPATASPTGVFIMRQYMISIPDELLESARMDGASEFGIFLRIVIPLSIPVIAMLGIFSFMWRWNDFLWPLIVAKDENKYTLQLAISQFAGEYTIDWSNLLAMSVISIVPIIIVFFFFQRYFVKGIMAGSVKG